MIILRFSDFEDANIITIDQHNDILKKNKFVLWGWFKKPYEHLILLKNSTWEYTKFSCNQGSFSIPNNIYLCNITKKEIYCAFCDNIYTKNNLPDEYLNYIPKYYNNNSEINYWFSLTNINKLEYDSFYERYGEDFDFSSDDTILMKKSINNGIIETNGNSILHISDLHCGTAFNYKMSNAFSSHRSHPILVDKLKKIKEDYDIGLIVASGDFSFGKDKKNSLNFSEAYKFLIELCNIFELEATKHLILVPGNHDKGFIDSQNSSKDINPLESKIMNNYDSDYRKFKNELTQNEQFSYLKQYSFPNGKTVNFACFDSSDLQSEQKREYGYIDPRQLEIIKELDNKDSNINFAVMHYPLMFPPVPTKIYSYTDKKGTTHAAAMSILENAFEISQKLTQKGIKYVLHGHEHIPYFGKYGMYDKKCNANLLFLCAGSLGLDTSNLYSAYPYNSFNIYTLNDKNELNVDVYKFTNVEKPQLDASFNIDNQFDL